MTSYTYLFGSSRSRSPAPRQLISCSHSSFLSSLLIYSSTPTITATATQSYIKHQVISFIQCSHQLVEGPAPISGSEFSLWRRRLLCHFFTLCNQFSMEVLARTVGKCAFYRCGKCRLFYLPPSTPHHSCSYVYTYSESSRSLERPCCELPGWNQLFGVFFLQQCYKCLVGASVL